MNRPPGSRFLTSKSVTDLKGKTNSIK